MVKGLDRFKACFENYTDKYVLIGGTAASLAMEEIAGSFRATKDLDIVLTIESLNPEFVKSFWAFIKEGWYNLKEKSDDAVRVSERLIHSNRQQPVRADGKPQFYRFSRPQNKDFPEMLELFSRLPDSINYEGEGVLTKIPAGEAVSSLSAILLNDDYYHFIHQFRHVENGLSYIGAEGLIPLKAKAYIDLLERKRTRPANRFI